MDYDDPTSLPLDRAFQTGGAGQFYCASLAIARIKQNNIPRQHVIWIGAQQCLALGYELATKGFLASQGVPKNDLRAMGHNLQLLTEKCIEHGIDSKAVAVEVYGLGEGMRRFAIEVGQDYRHHNFRYMDVPQIRVLTTIKGLEVSLQIIEKILTIAGFSLD